MTSAVHQMVDLNCQVHPLIRGGYLLLWPTWAVIPDDIFTEVVDSLMDGRPEEFTLSPTDSPMEGHAAWLIEPIT